MRGGSLNTISWPPSTHSDLANLDDAPIVILDDVRHLESATRRRRSAVSKVANSKSSIAVILIQRVCRVAHIWIIGFIRCYRFVRHG
jgi:hypothetical protein